jgi:hypothetical protein
MPMPGMMGFGGAGLQQQQHYAYMAAMQVQMQGHAMHNAAAMGTGMGGGVFPQGFPPEFLGGAFNASAAAGAAAQKLCASEAARLALKGSVATLEAEAAQLRAANENMQRRMQALELQISELLRKSSPAPADVAGSSDSFQANVTMASVPPRPLALCEESLGREGSRTRSSVSDIKIKSGGSRAVMRVA